jgi:hypothetical protein
LRAEIGKLLWGRPEINLSLGFSRKWAVCPLFLLVWLFMNIIELTSFVFCSSLMAGFLGSLTGMGGGEVIVPLLTLLFGVDIRYAIGASLASVIATSSGAAAANVKEGFSNMGSVSADHAWEMIECGGTAGFGLTRPRREALKWDHSRRLNISGL